MLRIGCVGLGTWGKILLKVWDESAGVEVAGLCRGDPDRLDEFEGMYSGAERYAAAADLMAAEDIDAVSIATPPPTHFELARQALEAGKHVFVEKPMCLRVDDAEALAALVAETDRILMVGHLMEHHGPVKAMKELIEGGEIGEVRHLHFQRLKLGRVRTEENVLWSFAPHDLSVAGYLLDATPSIVSATGYPYLQRSIEDIAFVDLMYAKGVSVHVHVSWLHPETVRKAVVVGSDGMIIWDDMADDDNKVIVTDSMIDDNLDSVEGERRAIEFDTTQPLQAELASFVECVEGGMQPVNDVEDGMRVVEMLCAATRSMESGELALV